MITLHTVTSAELESHGVDIYQRRSDLHAVSGGQVPVYKALHGEVVHTVGHLPAEGDQVPGQQHLREKGGKT